MYAISLGTGQSVTVGNAAAGNAVTYSGTASGLIVVLTLQQYALLPRATDLTTGVANYTDLSVPAQTTLDLAIPASAGTIVAGRVLYLGCSVQSAGAASLQIQDSKGSYNGTTYSAQTIQEVNIVGASGGDFEYYYPFSENPNGRLIGGIPVVGNLTVASITGTYTGVVRIGTR